jgi:cob(I)alamin adenosyltransferase
LKKPPEILSKRLVHVYTGPGKGKTTAAFGQAFRACGHGWKVLVIQFMKGDQKYGEIQSAKQFPNLIVEQYGLPTFVNKGNPSEKDRELAAKGFERARYAILHCQYDLIVLDEIHMAVDFGLIPLEELLSLIQQKPDQVELILTGRNAHPKVIALADLVSQIEEIKHPYQKDFPAREGIEF